MMTYYIPLDKFRCKYALSAFSRRKTVATLSADPPTTPHRPEMLHCPQPF